MWALPYSAAGDSIPIEDMDANMVKMYVQDTKLKFEEVFIPFKKLCKTKKVILFLVDYILL